ncbi:GNAT family N-acetyltransferase [Streptacidiphilus sp. PB12-B1b]|uniref:GNAT family N-acetyltransferase n=1 Tax=Streptacidiphilus sp. PB12-B1b TaxID=2705012 RepID=UPI0015FCC664|nr:GNAT family N-acetyltransferase [Streptacidiphilus sp. PB12-B1b]QMU77289.1 GNAT family N-acetyltransferase [Streptacidiphilus sp. PB12-B1b]
MPATDSTPPNPRPGIGLTVTDAPMPTDVSLISDALDRFNVDTTAVDDRRPLAVLVRDSPTGQVVGGLTGRTSLGLFFLDLFFLPPELRRGGLGSEILRRAEDEARARGCRTAVLYTISFQAPGFYEKHGWRRLGEVPCDPAGTSRVFMTKDLTPPTAP